MWQFYYFPLKVMFLVRGKGRAVEQLVCTRLCTKYLLMSLCYLLPISLARAFWHLVLLPCFLPCFAAHRLQVALASQTDFLQWVHCPFKFFIHAVQLQVKCWWAFLHNVRWFCCYLKCLFSIWQSSKPRSEKCKFSLTVMTCLYSLREPIHAKVPGQKRASSFLLRKIVNPSCT